MNNYQEIYGVTLDEYCQVQSTTVDQLIKKVKTDIKLLESRLQKLVDENEYVVDPLINAVFQTLKKKEKHLKRLKGWRHNGKA